MIANKRENNLKSLLSRSDPYDIKSDIVDHIQLGYSKCSRSCDSCKNFVIETPFITSFATGRRYNIRRQTSCTSESVIYVACCQKCGKQGVGSTVHWKKRLANYKSHIKKGLKTCKIVRHFIEECPDETLSNLKFIIVDSVNNTDLLSEIDVNSLLSEIDVDSLLNKEKFWIGTLVSLHKGLNGSHDWCRKKRTDREKIPE